MLCAQLVSAERIPDAYTAFFQVGDEFPIDDFITRPDDYWTVCLAFSASQLLLKCGDKVMSRLEVVVWILEARV